MGFGHRCLLEHQKRAVETGGLVVVVSSLRQHAADQAATNVAWCGVAVVIRVVVVVVVVEVSAVAALLWSDLAG